jgi:hypothetical protein
MRNLRPENDPKEALQKEQLEELHLSAPPEAVKPDNTLKPDSTVERQRGPLNAVEARFERVLQQELSGTSFSFNVERQTAERKVDVGSRMSRNEKRRTKLTPLSKARHLSASPFQGETILDKFVSFVAHLIKILERFLFRSRGTDMPKQKKQLSKPLELSTPKQKGTKTKTRWMRWSRM